MLIRYWHKRSALQLVAVLLSTIPFSSVMTFSQRRSALIQKLIYRKLVEVPNNLGLNPFPGPISHLGAPWQTLWILNAVQRYRQ